VRKKVLLVGLGRWGKIILRTLLQNPRADLRGVVTSKGLEAAADLPPECVIYSSLELASRTGPWDRVILATPPSVHAQQLAICLQNRWPTMVEKPLALSHKEALILLELAEKTNTPTLLDHTHLFHPAYEVLKKSLKDHKEEISAIESEGGNWGPFRSDYSALWDYGSHDLPWHLDLTGEFPLSLRAVEEPSISNGKEKGRSFRIELQFSRFISKIHVGNGFQEKKRWFRVQTQTGARYELIDHPTPQLLRIESSGARSALPFAEKKPLSSVIERFLSEPVHPHWGLELGAKVVRLLEACDESCREGRPSITTWP
jgi:predicted dehydrogenase